MTTELEIQKQKRADAEADAERLQALVYDLEKQLAEVRRAAAECNASVADASSKPLAASMLLALKNISGMSWTLPGALRMF